MESENTGSEAGNGSPSTPPPEPPRNASTRFAPGVSGNPRGRPKGSRNRATVLAQELLDGDVEAVVHKLVEEAKGGKPWALRLVIERLVPSRRSSAVEVELPRMERACDIALGVQAVIEAAAAGEITLDEAREFCALLESQRNILETSELEVRIEALEKREVEK
jgi:hypothetical protein